jgi:hypothetical protein
VNWEDGRIIAIGYFDGSVIWDWLKKILEFVDTELGSHAPIPNTRSKVYLAVASMKIVGLCVAKPLSFATKLLEDNGSSELYPVK